MDDTIKKIVDHWRRQSVQLNPGVQLTDIRAAELMTGYSFPDDFRALYMQVDGFNDNDWLENMFSIWPIERIASEHEDNTDSQFIGFSDFLIFSHAIGFRKDKPGVFKKYPAEGKLGVFKESGPGQYIQIADSFLEAIALINADADLIY